MYSTRHIKDLNSDTILERTSEYTIFSHYVGHDFLIGGTVRSPLRRDVNPSFTIYRAVYGKYQLRFRDNATLEEGSCFDLVMKLYNCTYFNALRMIDKDLNLKIQNGGFFAQKVTNNTIKERTPSVIEVKTRPWNGAVDRDFWLPYGITCKTLIIYDVYPLSHFTVNGHFYNCRDVVYGYYFGDTTWKVYAPKYEWKWFTNASSNIIQGYKQLPDKGDVLVITKSLKDCMLLYELGISAIAPQAENVLLGSERITELKQRFNRIFVNFDFDYTGVISGCKYKRKYGLQNLYLTNGRYNTVDYGTKDVTDYYKRYGREELIKLIKRHV